MPTFHTKLDLFKLLFFPFFVIRRSAPIGLQGREDFPSFSDQL